MDRAYQVVQFESVRGIYTERERLLDPYLSLGDGDLRRKIEEELSREAGDLKEKLSYLMGQYMKGERALEPLKAENLGLSGRVTELERVMEEISRRDLVPHWKVLGQSIFILLQNLW